MSIHAPPWSPARRALFRFGFVYWMLFCVPQLASGFPGLEWLAEHYYTLWNHLTAWVGKHVLHIGYEIHLESNGSGDTTSDYLGVLCCATLALAIAIVWSTFDRRRLQYARLHELLRVVIRLQR